MLVDGVEKSFGILFGKFSNSTDKPKKMAAWNDITKSVHAVGDHETRTVKQLKKKWSDYTSRSRKKAAENIKDRNVTLVEVR